MRFSGFFLKVGNYKIPLKVMTIGTYKGTANVLDLDSYRDANGKLHREALSHLPIKAEFETKAMMTEAELDEFLGNIEKNYTNAKERKFVGTAYIPELREYITQNMYMVTPDITPYGIVNGVLKFNSFRVAFIGY